MTYRIIVEVTAERDLESATHWLAQHSEPDARRWYMRVTKAIESLKQSPRRCPLAPENDAFPEEIRHLLHGKRRYVYRIVFSIRGNTIHILHIKHGALR